jgi:hypothetical protein
MNAAIWSFVVGFLVFEFFAFVNASSSSSCDDLCGAYFLELVPIVVGLWCALEPSE